MYALVSTLRGDQSSDVCDESVRGYTGADETVRNAFDLVRRLLEDAVFISWQILSDGVGLVKVLLAPALNVLVERYELRESSIITLREYRSLRYEREVGRKSYRAQSVS